MLGIVKSYMVNIPKSIAYAAVDVIGAKTPVLKDFTERNNELYQETYHAIRDYRTTIDKTRKYIQSTPVYKAGDLAFNNALEDILSGNLYNKEREDKILEDAAGFDDSDFGGDFGFDNEEGKPEGLKDKSEPATMGDKMIVTSIGDAAKANATAVGTAVAKTGQYVADTNKAIANLQYIQSTRMMNMMQTGFTNVTNGLQVLGSGIEIIKVNAENSKTFYENTTKTLNEQTAIMKEMLEMQRERYKKASEREKEEKHDTYDDVTSASGAPDLKQYGKAIFGNLKRVLNDNTFGLGDMLTEDNLKAMASNPLGWIVSGSINAAMGNRLAVALGKFNDTLGNVFANVVSRFNAEAKGNGIKSMIGKIFGLRSNAKSSIDTSLYEKGNISWNGKANKALTEVIPGYLSRIESALTGGEERKYNLDTGKWTTIRAIRKDWKSKQDSYSQSALSDVNEEFKKMMKDMEFETLAKKKQFEKDTKAFYKALYDNYGDFNEYNKQARKEDYGVSDSYNFKLIREMMKMLPRNVRASIARNVLEQRSSQDRTNTNLEKSGNTAYNTVFDNTEMGSINKYNEDTGKLKKNLGLLGTSKLIDQKDKYDRNTFDYLLDISETLHNIRTLLEEGVPTHGNGGGGNGHHHFNLHGHHGGNPNPPTPPTPPPVPPTPPIPPPVPPIPPIHTPPPAPNPFNIVPNGPFVPPASSHIPFSNIVNNPGALTGGPMLHFNPASNSMIINLGSNTSNNHSINNNGTSSIIIPVSQLYPNATTHSNKHNWEEENSAARPTKKLSESEAASNNAVLKEQQHAKEVEKARRVLGNEDTIASVTNLMQVRRTVEDYKKRKRELEEGNFIDRWLTGMSDRAKKRARENGEEVEEEVDENGNPKKQKSIRDQLNEATGVVDKANVIADNLAKFARKPTDILASAVEAADKHVLDLFFSKEANEVDPETGERIHGMFGFMKVQVKKTYADAKKWFDENIGDKYKKKFGSDTLLGATNNMIKKYTGFDAKATYASVKESILGNEETGQKGLLSPVIDGINSAVKGALMDIKEDVKSTAEDVKKAAENNEEEEEEEEVGSLAVGGYVPKTGLYMLSKGEAVVNSEENPDNPNPNPNIKSDARREQSMLSKLKKQFPDVNIVSDYANGTNKKKARKNAKMKYEDAKKIVKTGKLKNIPPAVIAEAMTVVDQFRENMGMDKIYTKSIAKNKAKANGETEKPEDKLDIRAARQVLKKVEKGNTSFSPEFIAKARSIVEAADTKRQSSSITAFMDNMLGNGDLKKTRQQIDKAKGTVKKYLPDASGGAVVGGVAGLFLGGPLIGAVLGSAISIAKRSSTVQNFLFGKTDKEGKNDNSGIFSGDTQASIKKWFPDAKKYGVTGAVLGLVGPFGPLTGLMLGSAVGFAKNNDTIKKALFGEKGLINTKNKEELKKRLPAMGIGAVAGNVAGLMLGGPFGILGNSLIGAGVGMLGSIDAFKDAMLGKPDAHGVRRGGVVGSLRDALVTPFKKGARNIINKMTRYVSEEMFAPVKNAMAPLGKVLELAIKKTFSGIGSVVSGAMKNLFKPVTDAVGHFLKRKVANSWIGRGLKKAAKIGGGIVGGILTAPSKAIGLAGDFARKRLMESGNADFMTSEERLKFAQDKKMSDYKYKSLDEAITNPTMDSEAIGDYADKLKLLKGNTDTLNEQLKDAHSKMGKKIRQSGNITNLEFGKINKMLEKGDYKKAADYINELPITAMEKQKMLTVIKEGQNNVSEKKRAATMGGAAKREYLADLSKSLGYNITEDNMTDVLDILEKGAKDKKSYENLNGKAEEEKDENGNPIPEVQNQMNQGIKSTVDKLDQLVKLTELLVKGQEVPMSDAMQKEREADLRSISEMDIRNKQIESDAYSINSIAESKMNEINKANGREEFKVNDQNKYALYDSQQTHGALDRQKVLMDLATKNHMALDNDVGNIFIGLSESDFKYVKEILETGLNLNKKEIYEIISVAGDNRIRNSIRDLVKFNIGFSSIKWLADVNQDQMRQIRKLHEILPNGNAESLYELIKSGAYAHIIEVNKHEDLSSLTDEERAKHEKKTVKQLGSKLASRYHAKNNKNQFGSVEGENTSGRGITRTASDAIASAGGVINSIDSTLSPLGAANNLASKINQNNTDYTKESGQKKIDKEAEERTKHLNRSSEERDALEAEAEENRKKLEEQQAQDDLSNPPVPVGSHAFGLASLLSGGMSLLSKGEKIIAPVTKAAKKGYNAFSKVADKGINIYKKGKSITNKIMHPIDSITGFGKRKFKEAYTEAKGMQAEKNGQSTAQGSASASSAKAGTEVVSTEFGAQTYIKSTDGSMMLANTKDNKDIKDKMNHKQEVQDAILEKLGEIADNTGAPQAKPAEKEGGGGFLSSLLAILGGLLTFLNPATLAKKLFSILRSVGGKLISTIMKDILPWIMKKFPMLAKLLSKLLGITGLTEAGGGLIDGLKDKVGGVFDTVKDVGGKAIDWAKDKAGSALEWGKDKLTGLKETGSKAIDWGMEKLEGAKGAVANAWNKAKGFGSNILSKGSEALNSAKEVSAETISIIKNKVVGALKTIGKYAAKLMPKNAATKLGKVFDTILERITNPKNAAKLATKIGIKLGYNAAEGAGLATAGIATVALIGSEVAFWFTKGMTSADEMFELKDGAEATLGMKVAAGLAEAITGATPVGYVLDGKDIIDIIKSVMGTDLGITNNDVNNTNQGSENNPMNNEDNTDKTDQNKSWFDKAKDFASNGAKWVGDKVKSGVDWAKDKVSGMATVLKNRFGAGKYGRGQFYSQLDPSVAGMQFNTSKDSVSQTIGDSACGPASMLNMASSLTNKVVGSGKYGRGSEDLVQASKDALPYKEKDGGVHPEYFKREGKKLGINTENVPVSSIDKEVDKGKSVILMGRDSNNNGTGNTPGVYGPYNHYITVTGKDNDGNFITQDPEGLPNQKVSGSYLKSHSSLAVSGSKAGMGKWGRGAQALINRASNIASAIRKHGRGKWGRGGDNAEKCWNFLKDHGFSNQAAAGVIGNLMQESGCDPNIVEGGGHANEVTDVTSGGFGICQWTDQGRCDKLAEYAKSKGKSSGDLDLQLDFMLEEASSYPGLFEKMNGATSVQEATEIWEKTYEGAGTPNMSNRIDFANKVFENQGKGMTTNEKITKSGSSSSSSSSSSSKDSGKDYSGFFGKIAKIQDIMSSAFDFGESSNDTGKDKDKGKDTGLHVTGDVKYAVLQDLSKFGKDDTKVANGVEVAKKVSQLTGLPADLVFAQMVNETGWFKSAIAESDHNYGGIKAYGDAKRGGEVPGNEQNGTDEGKYYRHFDDDAEYAEYYAKTLEGYKEDGLFEAKTPEEFAHALSVGGYYSGNETDYANALRGILDGGKGKWGRNKQYLKDSLNRIWGRGYDPNISFSSSSPVSSSTNNNNVSSTEQMTYSSSSPVDSSTSYNTETESETPTYETSTPVPSGDSADEETSTSNKTSLEQTATISQEDKDKINSVNKDSKDKDKKESEDPQLGVFDKIADLTSSMVSGLKGSIGPILKSIGGLAKKMFGSTLTTIFGNSNPFDKLFSSGEKKDTDKDKSKDKGTNNGNGTSKQLDGFKVAGNPIELLTQNLNGTVTSDFGVTEGRPDAGAHGGVDIGAPEGTQIPSTINGTAVWVPSPGYNAGYGNAAQIQDKNGNYHLFAHMDDQLISQDQEVKKGDVVGTLGNTGLSTGPHLHYEIDGPDNPNAFKSGNHINPNEYSVEGLGKWGLGYKKQFDPNATEASRDNPLDKKEMQKEDLQSIILHAKAKANSRPAFDNSTTPTKNAYGTGKYGRGGIGDFFKHLGNSIKGFFENTGFIGKDPTKSNIPVEKELSPNGKHYESNDVKYLLDKGYSRQDAISLLSTDPKYAKRPVAPNGKVYSQNDISYLTNHGYSQEDAISLLASSDKYNKKDQTTNQTTPSNTPNGGIQLPSILGGFNIPGLSNGGSFDPTSVILHARGKNSNSVLGGASSLNIKNKFTSKDIGNKIASGKWGKGIEDLRKSISDIPEDSIPDYNKILDNDSIDVAQAKATAIRSKYDSDNSIKSAPASNTITAPVQPTTVVDNGDKLDKMIALLSTIAKTLVVIAKTNGNSNSNQQQQMNAMADQLNSVVSGFNQTTGVSDVFGGKDTTSISNALSVIATK